MDCPRCHGSVTASDNFCSRCGARLVTDESHGGTSSDDSAKYGSRDIFDCIKDVSASEWKTRFAQVVADGVPGMVAYWSSDLHCRFANRAYLEWFGRKPNEVIGLHIRDLLGDKLFQANERYINGALSGVAQSFERTLTKADGSQRHTWAQYVPDVVEGAVNGFYVLVSDITELKRTQEALRVSEAEARRLAVVAARTHSAVILTDAAGRIEWVNEGFVRMSGYELDEIIGRAPGSFLKGPASDPEIGRQMRRAVEEGRDFQVEIVNYDKNGRRFWVHIDAQPIYDELGNVTQFMAIESDITERKQAEDLLRSNELRLRLALEVAGMLSWDWTVGINQVVHSQDYGAYFGLPDTGPVVPNDDTSLEPVHPDDRAALKSAFADSLETGVDFQFEFRGPIRAGEPTWYVTRGRFLKARNDQPRRMLGITQDVTLRKRAEESLRRSHEELERQVQFRTQELKISERRYRELVESTADAIFVKQDGVITFANSAFLRIIGIASTNDVLGRSPYEFIYADSRRVVRERVEILRTAGRVMPPVEVSYLRCDGTTVPVELTAVSFDDCGAVAVQVIARDLRERKSAESQVMQLREELAHAIRLGTMGEMASGLAHELNQPLAALRLYTSEAVELGTPFASRDLQKCLTRIDELSFRAGEIIRRMRAFVGRRPLQREHADVNQLIDEVLDLLSSDLRRSRITTDLTLTERLPRIFADKIQIQQVLVNLIRNAIESMTQLGNDHHRLAITTDRNGDSVRVRISDSGHGLDSAIAAKLFEPFQSTKPMGLGLGLTICRNLIDAHGGLIGAESNPTAGMTFFFSIPASADGQDG